MSNIFFQDLTTALNLVLPEGFEKFNYYNLNNCEYIYSSDPVQTCITSYYYPTDLKLIYVSFIYENKSGWLNAGLDSSQRITVESLNPSEIYWDLTNSQKVANLIISLTIALHSRLYLNLLDIGLEPQEDVKY